VLREDSEGDSDILVIGELRNEKASPMFQFGQECSRSKLNDLRLRVFVGQEIKRTGSEVKYILPPPRKWHFPGKLRDADSHVCQIYLVRDDIVIATDISKGFRINPIWKGDNDGPGRMVVFRSKSRPIGEVSESVPSAKRLEMAGEEISSPRADSQKQSTAPNTSTVRLQTVSPPSIVRTPRQVRLNMPSTTVVRRDANVLPLFGAQQVLATSTIRTGFVPQINRMVNMQQPIPVLPPRFSRHAGVSQHQSVQANNVLPMNVVANMYGSQPAIGMTSPMIIGGPILSRPVMYSEMLGTGLCPFPFPGASVQPIPFQVNFPMFPVQSLSGPSKSSRIGF
jgi:hypothetical protein